MHTAYVGIDGCKAGWLAFVYEHGQVTFKLEKSLATLFAQLPAQSLVLIDMPIGLADAKSPDRVCDKLARHALKPTRSSSVFPVPCRAAVFASSYEDACKNNIQELGKSLSKQSWAICPKIRELDELLQSDLSLDVRESHPEVVFSALNRAPLNAHKSTEDGLSQRLDVLQNVVSQLFPALQNALRVLPSSSIKKDDIVDAFALMVAASRPEFLRALPELADIDTVGLSRQIWFADVVVQTQQNSQYLHLKLQQQIEYVHSKLVNKSFQGKSRDQYGLRWLQLAEEHTLAILHLLDTPNSNGMPTQLIASAMALVRPAFEAAARGAWAIYVATDDDLQAMPKTISNNQMNLSTIVKKLTEHRFEPPSERLQWFATFSSLNKADLHDLTHGGFQQLDRRGTGNAIAPSFNEDEVCRLLIATIQIHKMVGAYLFDYFEVEV